MPHRESRCSHVHDGRRGVGASSAVVVIVGLLAVSLRAQAPQVPPPLDFVTVDRAGHVSRLGPAPAGAFSMRVSPDGTRVVGDSMQGIWVAAVSSIAERRVVSRTGAYPMWAPDGHTIIFTALSDGQEALFQVRSDADTPTLLIKPARSPESWPPQHNLLSFIELIPPADYSVWLYSFTDGSRTRLIDAPGSAEHSSQFSRDGRWIAYASTASGRWEVYARQYPDSATGIQLTRDGGAHPLWSLDDREIFFDRDSRLYALPIRTAPAVTGGAPQALSISGFVQGSGRRQFDLLPDGRFLMLMPGAQTEARPR